MSLESALCPSCGNVLKKNDVFCSVCGTRKIPSTFYSKLISLAHTNIVVISFILGIVLPTFSAISNYLTYYLINLSIIHNLPTITTTYIFPILSRMLYFIFNLSIIVVLLYVIKNSSININIDQLKKNLKVIFISAGLGGSFSTLLIDFILNPLINAFSSNITYSSVPLIFLPVGLFLTFISEGILTTLLITFVLLIQNDKSKAKHNIGYSFTKISFFGIVFGIIYIILFYVLEIQAVIQIIKLNSTESINNGLVTIELETISIVFTMIFIGLIYLFINKFALFLERKGIIRKVIYSYFEIFFGSLLGFNLYYLIYLYFPTISINLFLDPTLVLFIIAYSLVTALNVLIMYFSLIFIFQKSLKNITPSI